MAISLSSLNRLSVPKPPRIVIYGPHGIGKNTFAGAAPRPVLINLDPLPEQQLTPCPVGQWAYVIRLAFSADHTSAFGVKLCYRQGDLGRHDIFSALAHCRISRGEVRTQQIRKLAHDFRDDSSVICVAHGLCDALLIRLRQASG